MLRSHVFWYPLDSRDIINIALLLPLRWTAGSDTLLLSLVDQSNCIVEAAISSTYMIFAADLESIMPIEAFGHA